MKRIFAVIVLIISALNCTYSLKHYSEYKRKEIININDEIGEIIDADERSKYDLFNNVEGFQKARFYAITDGGYEVEIVTDRGKYVAVNRDLRAIQILKDYFQRYDETSYNQKAFENRWKIIDYDTLGFAISQQEVDKNIKHSCCIGATAGCFLVSLPLAAIVGFAVGDMDMNYGGRFRNPEAAFLSAAGIVTVFTVLGILYGKSQDDVSVVNRIKEARKPRVVE